jgi:hypothetical protein
VAGPPTAVAVPTGWRPAATRRFSFVSLAILISSLLPPPVAAAPSGYPVDPTWSPPAIVYIQETGHTLERLFLDYWRTSGGVWAFGNPITQELSYPSGRVVQYFEYARFDYRPTADGGTGTVELGKIGADLGPPRIVRRLGGVAPGIAADAIREARAWDPLTPQTAEQLALSNPTYRFVPETGHGVWGGFRSYWEGTGEAAYLGNPVSEEYIVDGTSYQVFERGKLRWRPGEEVAMVPVGKELARRHGLDTSRRRRDKWIPVYDESLFVPPIATPSLGRAPRSPVRAGHAVVISLGQQILWAYNGRKPVLSTYVSTGRAGFETPPGLFYVNTKLDVQTMEGVLGGEYYHVPDVPYVMYFTNEGHALHGTYWHSNFGTPMSHGCVNLPLDVAEWMYQWAPLGMTVLIIE